MFCFFFFKQKTAYEMRISDWSSDVCSSDLVGALKSLHPATVHFPIALLLMAALTELFVMVRRTPKREAAVKIMIYGGAAGAVFAALFGWIHNGPWVGGDTVLQLQRWNGMFIAGHGMGGARKRVWTPPLPRANRRAQG